MSRLRELVERELVVAACLQSALAAIRLGWRSIEDGPRLVTHVGTDGAILWHGRETPATWLDRAESSLRFAAAELAYLFGPAPEVATYGGSEWDH